MLCLVATVAALTGCGAAATVPDEGASTQQPDIVVSVINVTPFEVTVVLSGVLGDTVDTVRRTVPTQDSADVGFACVDEVVIGDPLDPDAPGVIVEADDGPIEFDPFAVFAGEAFACGDIIETIVSGTDPENIVVNVFAFTPP